MEIKIINDDNKIMLNDEDIIKISMSSIDKRIINNKFSIKNKYPIIIYCTEYILYFKRGEIISIDVKETSHIKIDFKKSKFQTSKNIICAKRAYWGNSVDLDKVSNEMHKQKK